MTDNDIHCLQLALLKGEFWEVRLEAARGFSGCRDPAAVEPLVLGLSDKNPGVNMAVGRALVGMKEFVKYKHIRAIGKILKNREWQIRGNAVRTLGRLGKPSAVPILIRALKDKDLYVRGIAAEALGELEDSRAAEALQSALYDKSPYVRRMAAEALGKIDDFDAIESVGLLVKADPDTRVRAAADEAFKKLERSKREYGRVLRELGKGLSKPVKKSRENLQLSGV